MELSELIFKSNTEDLERVSKVIGGLVTDISKLDKASRDAAKTEATLAKAAKDNAKANLDNAKAQDVRLKSTITTDKADKQAAAAAEKKAKATEKATEATARQTGVLQKQKDILEFQTQGFSKGQAGILAYGKAAGLAANDIEELGKVLETQRKLMGGDPFDKSLSGLKSLQNQYTELKESVRQYATDSNLSAKQTRELARDKERLIEKMKVEGASFSDIRKAVRAHNAEYVNLATSYNKMTSAEDAVIKSRKDAVNATNYLTQADAKMAAALNTSNAALDKAGTDSLVKYETALRKAGVSQDVATAKLAKYKTQLALVQAQEEKRREQHLTRALAPQATDVVVSLWSGQNPLTVLLQQGGQINDLFMQSGIAAERFGEVVKKSMSSMLPSIKVIARGIGGLVVDGFMAAGSSVAGFLAKITGLNWAMDSLYKTMARNGPSQFAGWIQNISGLLRGGFAAGIALVTVALVSLGVTFKNAIVQGAELTRSLELTGASLGLTKSAAIEVARGLASAERPIAKVVDVINELAKTGKFSSENIALVTNAAIDLERYGKVSIADTAKELVKLKDDPVKALIEVAAKTGYVNLETIETVKSLREQGRMADAAKVAMTAWAESSSRAATGIKNQMSPLEQVWDSMLSKINKVIGKLQDLARGSGLAEQIADKEAQLASVKGGFFTSTFGLSPKGRKDIDRLNEEIYLLKLQLQAETDITNERKRRASAAAQVQAEAEAVKDYTSSLEKQSAKEMSLTAFVKKSVEDRTKTVAAALGKNVEDVKLSAETITTITKGAEAEWKKIQEKPKKDPSENYYATLMREATNNTIAAVNATEELTKSELKLLEVKSDPRFKMLTSTQQADVAAKYEGAIAAEKQTRATKELGDAENRLLAILGKSSGIGRKYYADLEAMEKDAKLTGKTREEIEELTRALFQATPVWKAYEKALEDVNTASRKFQEDSLASQASVLQENRSLDHRLSLLGKTTEEQKALVIEYNRTNKLREVDVKLAKQLREIEDKIAKAKKDGLKEGDYQAFIDAELQARKDAAEEQKVINREVAVQYAEYLQKEIDAIRNGITDSIVTALFEGGKAGSKKLRDVLVSVLRQKVTMVVDVGVNAFMNSLIGGALGGSTASSAGGGVISSLAGSATSSLIGGSSLLAPVVGAMNGFTTAALASAQSLIGITGTTAQMATSLAAAGHTAAAGMAAGAKAFSAIPGWGWAIAGIAALGSIFSKKSTPHSGGASIYSAASGLSNVNLDAANSIGFSARNDAGVVTFTNQIAKTLTEVFDSTAVAFGKTAGYEITAAFADDTSKDGAWGQLRVKQGGQSLVDWTSSQTSKWAPKVFADGEAGQQEYFAAIALSVRDALSKAIGEVEWAQDMLKALGDSPTIETLSRTVQQINAAKQAFVQMGKNLVNFGTYTDAAISALVKAMGGIDGLVASASTYYENFYTEAERAANTTRDVAEALAKVGVEMPKTREAFRAELEARKNLGESGVEAVAVMLKASEAFASITKSSEELKTSLIDLYKEEVTRLESLTSAYDKAGEVLKTFKDKLLLGALSTATPMQKYEKASADYASLFAKAMTGDTEDIDKFSDMASNYLEFSRLAYASGQQYTSDFNRVTSDVDKVLSAAQGKKSESAQMLEAAKSQVEYLSGIDSSVKTLAEAIQQYSQSLAASFGATSATAVMQAYAGIGRTGFGTAINQIDISGFDYWLNDIKAGGLEGFQQRFSGAVTKYLDENPDTLYAQHLSGYVPQFAQGGFHQGGARIVGERGPELEVTGAARYFSAEATGRILRNADSSDSDMATELSAIRQQLAELQKKLVEAVVEGAILNARATEQNTEIIGKTVKESGSKQAYVEKLKRKVANV